MEYLIKHNDPEDIRLAQRRYPDAKHLEWTLLEVDGKPMELGTYETEDQAKFALLYWQTIELVQTRLEEFRDDLATEIGILNSVLDQYIEEALN